MSEERQILSIDPAVRPERVDEPHRVRANGHRPSEQVAEQLFASSAPTPAKDIDLDPLRHAYRRHLAASDLRLMEQREILRRRLSTLAALAALIAVAGLAHVTAVSPRLAIPVPKPAHPVVAQRSTYGDVAITRTRTSVLVRNGRVQITFDLVHGALSLHWPGTTDTVSGATGVLLRGQYGSGPARELMAGDYIHHSVATQPLAAASGPGVELLLSHTDPRHPPLVQHITVYSGGAGVLLQTEIGSKNGPVLEASRIDTLRSDDAARIALPGGMKGLVLAVNATTAGHMPRQTLPVAGLGSDGSLPYLTAIADPGSGDTVLAGALRATTWFPSVVLQHSTTALTSVALANIGPAGGAHLFSEPYLLGHYASEPDALRAYTGAIQQAGLTLNWSGGVQMGWSSWGAYELNVTAGRVMRNAQFMADHLRSYGYTTIHIDDGWEQRYGDWQPNSGFPDGMVSLVTRIHALGLKASLWYAPFLVSPTSWPARVHPDWLLRNVDGSPTNITIDGPVYILDATNPAALAYIASVCAHIRQWGFDAVKLDFLYTGSMVGQRYRFDQNGIQAYNAAMRVVRGTLEADRHHPIYLTGVQQGLLPSGYFQAWRVGRDIESKINADHIPTWDLVVREALAVSTFAFVDEGLYTADPDDLLLRNVKGARNLSADELQTYAGMVALGGTVWLAGDDLPQLAQQGRLGYLTNPEVLDVVRSGRAAMPLAPADQADGPALLWYTREADGSTVVGVFNWSDRPATQTVTFADLGLPAGGSYDVRNLWARTDLGVMSGDAQFTMRPHQSYLLRLTPQ